MTELEEIMTDQQAYSVLTAMADDADDFEQRVALEVALDALGERMGQLCVDETPSHSGVAIVTTALPTFGSSE